MAVMLGVVLQIDLCLISIVNLGRQSRQRDPSLATSGLSGRKMTPLLDLSKFLVRIKLGTGMSHCSPKRSAHR